MAILKINADQEMIDCLTSSAIRELRPIDWQAEVLLRRALGLPFPKDGQPVAEDVADGG